MISKDKIYFKNVSKKYGEFTALNKISFEIPRNSIVGLIGANGSGKTTLIKCLLAYFCDFTGEISIFGEKNTNINQKNNLLSYIPDSPVLYEELTMKEHLDFISKMYHTQDKEDELVREFELETQLDKFPHELSKGNRQKLLICCALLREYSLLVSDEPFSGLDPRQINKFKEKILELKKEGKTIIISTHLLNLIENLCDYFIMIDQGNLIGVGNIIEIIEKDFRYKSLEELYFYLSENKRDQEGEEKSYE